MKMVQLEAHTVTNQNALAVHEFEELPPHLRETARIMLNRFFNGKEAFGLSREEMVSAMTSSFFLPVLEQEARFNTLGYTL
ncbi:hypothetical protein E6C67_18440 [Azospirillum sp. TSA2s]|uniref:hypothetical protein n=1 Tax=Azospirillum sp. TSA2s TaxID=709810 RepID=UPI0010AAFD69|nr:hypothetical protein [Azospirillum sp. TSA2s]QCG95852.1 hypothetical protein E6C67_18440 [Azospirillum sp. TSA2s]